MYTTVEISYYPLSHEFIQPVEQFLAELANLQVEVGTMSSLVSGEYKDIMQTLIPAMEKLMQAYPSVFTLKISNACQVQTLSQESHESSAPDLT
jgi:uncharacterized protein YqgV (UPF0045/DUF77 family)